MYHFKSKTRRPTKPRATLPPSLYRAMTPAQSREARAIAYRAALAVLG